MLFVFLFSVGLISATVSGVAGMAGGITLLAGMTLVMPMSQIVPLHGVAQLISNFSRTYFLRKNVDRRIMMWFLFGTPFGGVLGYALLSRIQRPEWLFGLIAFLLLYVAFKPGKLPEIRLPHKGYAGLGFVAATLGCLMGATGPLLAPFFVRSDLSKESIVATKAACQIFVHLAKLPVFLALAFPYMDHLVEILVLVASVILGTKLGTTVLRGISTDFFMKAVKILMVVIALRLIYKMMF